jgi:outer membrane murein-binding lipoprotein Lpp
VRGRTAGCRGGFAGRRAARAVSSDEHTTHSARSRASQFQETAKELRDAHTEFGGRLAAAKAGEDEVRFAFPGELNGGAEGGDERQAVDEAADDAADEASGGHVEEDAGDDAPGDGPPGGSVPRHTVSERLAALKEKLQQKRPVSSSRDAIKDEDGVLDGISRLEAAPDAALDAAPAAVSLPRPAPEREQVEGGTSGRLNSDEVDRKHQEHINRLRIEVEKEVSKNTHLLGLYEDAMVNAREAAGRADGLEEEVRKLKQDRDALVEAERLAKEEATKAREEADRAVRGDDIVNDGVSLEQREEAPRPSSSDRESKEVQSLKEQLDKLKMQMLATQTAFEEQIEAEVQERVAALTQGTLKNVPKGRHEDDEQLLADLEIALDKISEAEKESAHWKSEAERMRDELGNMQIALDELRYESENGEKLRVQVRTAQAEVREMEARVAEALASKDALELKAQEAAQKAEEERRRAFAAREAEGLAKKELIALQVAFSEMDTKVNEGGRGAIERDTVVEVLKDMSGMRHGSAMKYAVDRLNLSEAERRKVLGDSSGLASTFVAFLETAVEENS